MKALTLGKRITSLLLCASVTGAVFSGCKKSDDMFPSIEPSVEQAQESEPGEQVVPDKSDEDKIQQLSVALPYSDLTIQCLVSMLYCKNNGKWDSSEDGLTVDTDYLSSVATNYVVTNVGCGNSGANLEMIDAWRINGATPDLFLAQDSRSVWEAGYCSELNDSLADNPYLNNQMIYADALEAESEKGVFFAVPHCCSAEILMGNTRYIPAESGKLQTKCTAEELRTYLEAIKAENPSVAGISGAYELIPYLGSAFNGDMPTSYMVYDEYMSNPEEAKKIIDASASYVRALYSDSLAMDQIDGKDPIFAKKTALWIGSSADVRTWAEYYPDSLYMLHLPCDNATNVGVPYISTYSLCVSKTSRNKDFAAEFAAFISFDPDAQLLIYRLENMTGFMPITRNEAVWSLVSNDELFGYMASDFRQIMDNAVYCPSSYDNNIFANTTEYAAGFVKGTEEFSPEKCYG
ncbi:MAG: hypothetical protein MJ084_03335 [Saccharofermentans sp.]|nr:hypothetical protein [Saccharofermentans sp.]